MALKLGYLLPTRERIMSSSPSVRPMIDAAMRASDLGFDSIWAGDSLIARPRHDPITLLAGVAGAIPHVEVGTEYDKQKNRKGVAPLAKYRACNIKVKSNKKSSKKLLLKLNKKRIILFHSLMNSFLD